jgi:hypothetical protein
MKIKFTKVCHHVPQLGRRDETVAVLVEHLSQKLKSTFRSYPWMSTFHHLERFKDFLFGIGVLHLAGHEGQEFREIDGSVTIRIDLQMGRINFRIERNS